MRQGGCDLSSLELNFYGELILFLKSLQVSEIQIVVGQS